MDTGQFFWLIHRYCCETMCKSSIWSNLFHLGVLHEFTSCAYWVGKVRSLTKKWHISQQAKSEQAKSEQAKSEQLKFPQITTSSMELFLCFFFGHNMAVSRELVGFLTMYVFKVSAWIWVSTFCCAWILNKFYWKAELHKITQTRLASLNFFQAKNKFTVEWRPPQGGFRDVMTTWTENSTGDGHFIFAFSSWYRALLYFPFICFPHQSFVVWSTKVPLLQTKWTQKGVLSQSELRHQQ